MWLIERVPDKQVAIVISNESICLGIIQAGSMAASKKLELHAWRTIANDQLTIDSIIFNPTRLAQQINSFARIYHVENACATLCIGGPGMFERLVAMDTAHAQPHDFSYLKISKLSTDYQYLYANEQGKFVFYLAGIAKEIAFQYQMLMARTSLRLVALTSQSDALLCLYRNFYGSAFRQTQLARDIEQCERKLEKLFTHDMLHRLIAIRADYRPQEFTTLLTMTGLHLSQQGTV